MELDPTRAAYHRHTAEHSHLSIRAKSNPLIWIKISSRATATDILSTQQQQQQWQRLNRSAVRTCMKYVKTANQNEYINGMDGMERRNN